jgi:dTDP-4-amino-4,6-dideoxygalactose transaminase
MKPADFIPFHRPSLGGSERQAVLDVLESGWLTTGSRAQEFEERFGAFVGSRHAVAVNSATAALHLALEGIGVGEDDEVIIPTYTFAASGETVLYQRARPVLVDVDADSLGADPAAVGAAVTERTKAVEVVHIGGLPADLARIQASVQEAASGLGYAAPPVGEAAAHAVPSPMPSLDGRFAGTVGRAGAFSFYATKTITTGEGGMLVTDDDDLAARARTMRLHGISHDAWKRYSAAGNWFYEITAAGFKDNLTDLAAALGLAQLDRAGDLRRARASIADRYLAGLSGLEAEGRLKLPSVGTGDEHAWHLFVIRLADSARGPRSDEQRIDNGLPGVVGLPKALRPLASRRARAIEHLRSAGIGVSVHFIPLHLHPLYRSMGYRPGDFPVAETAYAGAISLPIWPDMSAEQVDRVIEAVCAVS